jgi:fucose permease
VPAWTAPAYPLAVLGLLVVGLGAALLFPLGAARALDLSGGLTDLASGRNGVAAGVAAGAFPFLLGALADRVQVQAAFLLVPVLVVVAAACVLATEPRPAAVG